MAGSDERLRGWGGPGPERAFITRLTGGRWAGRAASGRAGKEASGRRGTRECLTAHRPVGSGFFGSTLILDFLELGLSAVGAGPGCRIWGAGTGHLNPLLRLGDLRSKM